MAAKGSSAILKGATVTEFLKHDNYSITVILNMMTSRPRKMTTVSVAVSVKFSIKKTTSTQPAFFSMKKLGDANRHPVELGKKGSFFD